MIRYLLTLLAFLFLTTSARAQRLFPGGLLGQNRPNSQSTQASSSYQEPIGEYLPIKDPTTGEIIKVPYDPDVDDEKLNSDIMSLLSRSSNTSKKSNLNKSGADQIVDNASSTLDLDANDFNPDRIALTDQEKYMISKINGLRLEKNLGVLQVSYYLMDSSRKQAKMMSSYRSLRHNLVARYFKSYELIDHSGYEQAIDRWTGSSSCYEVLFNPKMKFIGVSALDFSVVHISTYAEKTYVLDNYGSSSSYQSFLNDPSVLEDGSLVNESSSVSGFSEDRVKVSGNTLDR